MKRFPAIILIFLLILASAYCIKEWNDNEDEQTSHSDDPIVESYENSDEETSYTGDSNFAEYKDYFDDLSEIDRLAGKVYTDDDGDIYSFGHDGYCDCTLYGVQTETGTVDTSVSRKYTVKGNRMFLNSINVISVYEIDGDRLVKVELGEGEIPQEMHLKED